MIRELGQDDWAIYKALRLEALQGAPLAFGAAYEDEAARDEAYFRHFLGDNHVLAYLKDGHAVGMVGYYVNKGRNFKHRGRMFGMYVQPAWRGKGIGDALMDAVLTHARARIEILFCGVHDGFDNALSLYRRYGFEVWGVEPRATKFGDRYVDCTELARSL